MCLPDSYIKANMQRNITVLVVLALIWTPFYLNCEPNDFSTTVSNGSAFLTLPEYSGIKLDLKPFSAASLITKADILFASQKDRVSYVVIFLSGPTRENGSSGYCGAGMEENLVWMKLSANWILEVRGVLVSSCAVTIEGESPRVNNDGIKLKFSSYPEGKQFNLIFDSKAPEQGFQISSHSLQN